MEFHGPDHIYEIAPPHFGNRALPAQLLGETLAALKETLPEGTTDAEIWRQAVDKVRAENKMVWFGVRAVHMPDMDQLDREIAAIHADNLRDKAIELEAGKRRNQVKEKLASINNLVVDGRAITTFEDFYKNGPPEMVQWLIGAIRVTEVLQESQRKNFLPE